MYNFLKLNDWPIRKFLAASSILVILYLSTIALQFLNLQLINLLRPITGFLILAYLPGILLLRILKIHNLSSAKTVLYSVGLSLISIIVLGLLANSLLPLCGFTKPLSETSLQVLLATLLIGLSSLAWFREKENSNSSAPEISISPFSSPWTLFALIIPMLSIMGVLLLNSYGSNILLLIVILLIAVLPIGIGFEKIPKKLYVLTIFAVSISLLYNTSLLSNFISGWDLNITYYFSKLVKSNSLWEPMIESKRTSLLSLVMLSPIFSNICGLSLAWVYKIFYTLLFSLLPIGLYCLYESEFDKKVSVLGSLFFMFHLAFFIKIPGKQRIAELFLVFLLVFVFDKNICPRNKAILSILFLFGMIQSHYSVSYLFLFSLVFLFLAYMILRKPFKLREKIDLPITKKTFLALGFVMAISWYLYTGGGFTFSRTIRHLSQVQSEIINFLMRTGVNPRSGAGMASSGRVALEKFTFYFNIFFYFLITVGIINIVARIFQEKKMRQSSSFSILAIAFFALQGVSMLAVGGVGADRMVLFSLLLLSPFVIVGCKLFIEGFQKHILGEEWKPSLDLAVKFISVGLGLLVLFNTSFVNEVTNTPPVRSRLNPNTDAPIFERNEVNGAEWIKGKCNGDAEIYAGWYGRNLLLQYYSPYEDKIKVLTSESVNIPPNSCIFLRPFNVNEGKIYTPEFRYGSHPTTEIKKSKVYENVIIQRNKIYTNGGSEVYR